MIEDFMKFCEFIQHQLSKVCGLNLNNNGIIIFLAHTMDDLFTPVCARGLETFARQTSAPFTPFHGIGDNPVILSHLSIQ